METFFVSIVSGVFYQLFSIPDEVLKTTDEMTPKMNSNTTKTLVKLSLKGIWDSTRKNPYRLFLHKALF